MKNNIESIYPLSPMQQGMLFDTLYAPESKVYFQQSTCNLHGLNVLAFKQAWQRLVERHSILRTAFVWQRQKEPFQVVYRDMGLPWEQHDWQGLSLNEQQEQLIAFLQADREQSFKLSKAPLMRLVLIQMNKDTYQFIWSHHHLLLDGWSLPLVLKELFAFYKAFSVSQELHLEPSRPYQDYITWLQQQDLSQAEVFWRQKLKGISTPTTLVVGTSDSLSSQEKSYDEQRIQLSMAVTSALHSLAQHHHLTLNTLVQGAWALLLSRYSGQSDVIFGATVAGRPETLVGVESMVGLFINTLPIRVSMPPEVNLLDWLKQLQAQQVELREYEYSSLVQIQGWSDVPRGLPLFESIVVFENYPMDDSLPKQGGLEIHNFHVFEGKNYPLSLVAEPGSELSLQLSYDCQRFDSTAIARMLKHLQSLLKGIVANPQQRLIDLPLLTEVERQQLLVQWNHTIADYPQVGIHQLFEAQVERTPDATAVLFADQQLTYRQLNCRANQLAHHLRSLGVGADSLVGLCLDRSLEMVVGLLGILKAGGAYVPLDPKYPQERLAFMLSDTQAAVLLTQQHLVKKLPTRQLPSEAGIALLSCPRVICLDAGWEAIALHSEENVASGVLPGNLAYVIYTSGSTGRPKGALMTHRGLCNLAKAQQQIFNVQSDSRLLQFASLSFDVSTSDVVTTLCSGATLYLANADSLLPGSELIQVLRNRAITHIELPVSVLGVLSFEDLPALQTIIVGGESCSASLVERWASERQFFNAYGPTEATVCTTVAECTQGDQKPSIGRPIANMQVYILDAHLQPVAIGVPGEIYIGGAGLARGYLNRPDLTAEKFVPHPFNKVPGDRLYQTGDRACFLADGNIDFLGRIDNQVKIRGFRIELGEVEAVLEQHPAVQQTVVVLRDAPGNKRLVAYIASKRMQAPTVSELHSFLGERLPEHAIPSVFILLETLPLTPNGKIDRQALPEPDKARPELAETFVSTRTPIEEQLVQIWAEVLGLERIGIHDNFFELGGHSLLAIQLISRMSKAFEVDLPLHSLFEKLTVAGMSQVINVMRGSDDIAAATNALTVIDLNAEVVLDPTICPGSLPVMPITEPNCIFLTGATGFLGAFLLYELLQQTQADIYCLVRSSSVKEGKKRIEKNLDSYALWNNSFSSRIIPVIGDLSQPLLGLATEQFQMMASKIDVIYHNGALVNFIYPYSAIKAANVLGTQEVLRLASQIKVKPVHFISTLSVFSPVGEHKVKVFREQDNLEHNEGLELGYTQSKWVAEKLVMIARDRGLPVCTYRSGRVTGHSQTGACQADDFLWLLIKGCIQLGSVPDLDMTEDMTPVDFVSEAIVHLSRQKESLGKAFHLINPYPLHLSKLVDLMRSFGYPLEQISSDKWQSKLIHVAGSSPENAAHPLVPLFSGGIFEKEMSDQIIKPYFDCQNTLEGLAGTSIVCPSVDTQLLATYFSYFIDSGFLQNPQQIDERRYCSEKILETISVGI